MRLISICICGLLLAGASAAYADPLSVAALPENTLWVIHLDVDAARTSPLWERALSQLAQPRQQEMQIQFQAIERMIGLNVQRDLHDLTLYGFTYDASSACIVLHAPFDHEAIKSFLKANPEYAEEDHNGHTVMTWRDKRRDGPIYAAFADKDIAILSPSSKVVSMALDTLDQKSPAIKPPSPLIPSAIPLSSPTSAAVVATAPAAPASPAILFIAGRNLADLARRRQPNSPLFSQIDAASIALGCSREAASARVQVTAASDQAAQQMVRLVAGIQAMAAMSAEGDRPAPRAKAVSSALQGLNISASGDLITCDWTLSLDKIDDLVENAQENAPSTLPRGGRLGTRNAGTVSTQPEFGSKKP